MVESASNTIGVLVSFVCECQLKRGNIEFVEILLRDHVYLLMLVMYV